MPVTGWRGPNCRGFSVISRRAEASEAEESSGQLQQLATGGAGEDLRDHSLPRHFHEGGAGPPARPHRGQSAGSAQSAVSPRPCPLSAFKYQGTSLGLTLAALDLWD